MKATGIVRRIDALGRVDPESNKKNNENKRWKPTRRS